MSDPQEQQATWYLARDGQQYGPIKDEELRKLVELNHLQVSDLVWSPAYTEWQPASVIIELFSQGEAQKPAPPAAPPAAPEAPAQTPAGGDGQDRSASDLVQPADHSAASGQPAWEQTQDPARQTVHEPRQETAEQAPATQSLHSRTVPQAEPAHPGADFGSDTGRQSAPQPARSAEPMADYQASNADQAARQTGSLSDALTAGQVNSGQTNSVQATVGQRNVGQANFQQAHPSQAAGASAEPGPQDGLATLGRAKDRDATGPGGYPGHSANANSADSGPRQQPVPQTQDRGLTASDEYDSYEEEDESRGGGLVKALVAALTIGLIGAGGWFAYQERDSILAMVSGGSSGNQATPIVRASDSGAAIAPQSAGTGSQELQRIAFLETDLWNRMGSAFPDWTTARQQEVRQMQDAGRQPTSIELHLIGQIAQLRRRYANDALSASPASLRSVASAFLTNLRTLTSHSTDTCYAFISSGETSPKVMPLMRDPKASETLLRQMQVVVDAIVEGRQKPTTYLPPRPSDYSVISGELSKMGWTNTDMRLFGDPQALSKASPAKVCQLVTDWFTAQLMVGDPQVQSRLLVQSLRPVVAG